jgi:hypothetical protein
MRCVCVLTGIEERENGLFWVGFVVCRRMTELSCLELGQEVCTEAGPGAHDAR